MSYPLWVALYFAIGFVSLFMPPLNATLRLDREIPFVPEMLWVYLSCYLMPFYLVLITKDWHRFNIVLLCLVFAHLLAFAVYINFPVTVQKPELGQSFSEQTLSMMYSLELRSSMNNLPSLHVTFALAIALGSIHQSLTRRGEIIVFAWAFLTAASPVFVAQHAILDLVSAFANTALSWLLAQFFYRKLFLRSVSPRSALMELARRLGLWILAAMVLMLCVAGIRWMFLVPD